MKKLMVAIAGAVAMTCSAFAGTWFNGGIAEGWPTAGTGLTGGTWSNTSAATFETDKLVVEADDTTGPLTFEATTAKGPATSSEIVISATVTFTPFETLPAVPADAKAGVIIAANKYYGIGKVDEAAAWVELGTAADTDEAKAITVTRNADGITYKVGDTTFDAVTPVSDAAFQYVNMSGDGELAVLEATTTDYVEPTMVIIGEATSTKEGDTYTFTPNAGYTIGSIMINGVAQAFTPGEGGVVTFTTTKSTAAQYIVVATDKTVVAPENKWFAGIGAVASNVMANTSMLTAEDYAPWHGVIDGEYFGTSFGTSGKAVQLWNTADLAETCLDLTASNELYTVTKSLDLVGKYTAGTDLRGVAISRKLNLFMGLNDAPTTGQLYSMPLDAEPIWEGENQNAWIYPGVTAGSYGACGFDAGAISDDAQYLYTNGESDDKNKLYKWRILNGFKGANGGLEFVGAIDTGFRARSVAVATFGGKDYVFGLLNGTAGVVMADMTGTDSTKWTSKKVVASYPLDDTYGSLCVSGLKLGTPHLVVAPSLAKSNGEHINRGGVYVYDIDFAEQEVEQIKYWDDFVLQAAGFGITEHHLNSIAVSDDESTFYFGRAIKAVAGVKAPLIFTAQYCAPQAITVTPDANATYTLTVNGAAAESGDTFEAGAAYTVVATPKEDYKYTEAPAGWTLTEGSLTQSGTLGLAAIAITIPAPVQDEIEFTVQPIANATYEVDGATAVAGKDDTYKALPDTDITVTYTADEGYLFSDGTTTLVAQGKATKGGKIVPSETEVTKGAVKIGTTYYLTLAAAIDAAEADQTVTLCADIETSTAQQWTIAKNITLDFNGYTITKKVTNDWVFTIASGADVTFAGTAGGITFKPYANGSVGSPASMIQIFGKLTVNGGTYVSDYTIFKVDAENTARGQLVVNGGTMTIVDGRPAGKNAYALMNWGDATINGGTWTGDLWTLSYGDSSDYGMGVTEIKSIAGTPAYKFYLYETTDDYLPKFKGVEAADVTIGYADASMKAYVVTKVGDYVTVAKAVAKSGTTYYLTLAEAFAAGGEITLLADVEFTTMGNTLNVTKDTTLDLAGKKVEMKDTEFGFGYLINVKAGKTLTIKDTVGTGVLKNNGIYGANSVTSLIDVNGTLVLDGGTLQSNYACVKTDDNGGNGVFTMNGGTLEITGTDSVGYTGKRFALMSWTMATVKGGTVKGNVEACTYKGGVAGTLVIEGGTFDPAKAYLFCYDSYSTTNNMPVLKIKKSITTLTAEIDNYKGYADNCEVSASEEGEYNVYSVKEKSSGPTPGSGSDVKVDPVPGQENTYKVEPTGTSKDVLVDNVKDGDTLIIDGSKVDSLGVNGGESSGATIKVTNSAGTEIPNGAFKGWNGNTFDATLDETASVKIGEETIPVKPAATADDTTPISGGAVATKTIPGLTYQLVRGDEPGQVTTLLTTEGATATATTTSTTLTDVNKPETKAFYKIQVTK